MPGPKNKYNVYDVLLSKYVLKNVYATDIEKSIGLGKAKVSIYANRGHLYRNRFRIFMVATKELEHIHYTAETKKLMKEWDRMRQAALLLKTGRGRLVQRYIHGKIIKYVEAIE